MIHNVLYDEKESVIYFQIINKQQRSSEEIIMDFSMKDVLPNVVSNDKCKSKGMLWESKLKDKYQFEVELNANIPVKNRIVKRNNKQYDMFLTILNESITTSQRVRNRVDKPFMLDILNDSIKYFKFIKQRSHMVAVLKIIKSYLINHFDCIILYKPSTENESRNNNNNNLSDRSYSSNNNNSNNTLQSNKSYKSVNSTIINKHTRNETQLYRRLFRNHFLQKSNSNVIKTGEIPLTVASVQQKEDITSSIVSKDVAQKEQSKNEVIFSYVGSNTTNMNKTNISNGLTTINNNNNNSNINNNITQIETRSNNNTITIHKIKPKVINLCKNNYLFYKPQSLKFSSNNKKEFTLDDEESDNSNNNNTTSINRMIKKKVISKAKSYIDIKHPNENKMLCGFIDSYINKKNEYEEYRKQLKARKGLQFYLDNIKRNEMLNPAYYIKLKERELRYEKYLQRQKLKAICNANGNKCYFMNVINNEQHYTSSPKKNNNNNNKHN